jgi:hypothetical protein
MHLSLKKPFCQVVVSAHCRAEALVGKVGEALTAIQGMQNTGGISAQVAYAIVNEQGFLDLIDKLRALTIGRGLASEGSDLVFLSETIV